MATTHTGEPETTTPDSVPMRRARPAWERWFGWFVEQVRFMTSLPQGRQKLVTRRAMEALVRAGVRTQEVAVTLVAKPTGMVLVVEAESTDLERLYSRFAEPIGLYVCQSLRRRYGLVVDRVLFIGGNMSVVHDKVPPGPISAEWLYRTMLDARGGSTHRAPGGDIGGQPSHLQSQPLPALAPARPEGLARVGDPGFEVQSLPGDAMDAFFSATVPADRDGEPGPRVALR